MTDYTEQDTERARQAERSSAGQPTQNLGPLPASLAPAPARAAGGRSNLAALALIAVGALVLFGYLPDSRLEIEGGMILLTIASCFAAAGDRPTRGSETSDDVPTLVFSGTYEEVLFLKTLIESAGIETSVDAMPQRRYAESRLFVRQADVEPAREIVEDSAPSQS